MSLLVFLILQMLSEVKLKFFIKRFIHSALLRLITDNQNRFRIIMVWIAPILVEFKACAQI